jgi:hypothetical protein
MIMVKRRMLGPEVSGMWAVLGLLVAAAIGLITVLSVGGRGSAVLDDYPWLLDEVSKLHVNIVGSLAGFAFTGVVLVVTLARDRTGAAGVALDAAILMFLVAYLYWVGSAFLISYLPHVRTSGDFVQRVHFSLASTIEYRTVFLSWFALLPLLQLTASTVSCRFSTSSSPYHCCSDLCSWPWLPMG